MKIPRLAFAAMLMAMPAQAADTTPPTLSVPHTWVEKVGTQNAFKLLLDPKDETGIHKIQYRFKINSTLPLPDSTAWVDWLWMRGLPLRVQATAKSFVIEMRALDVAGNSSPIQRRTFASPLPLGTAPNLEAKFVADKVFPATGPTPDCRGMFGADFDGDGRDDILQVDRPSGIIKVRRQQSDGTFVTNGFTVATNAVSDSAMGDFNDDGRPDLALVVNGALVVYQNDGLNVTTLQFSVMNVTGLSTTGITTVVGVAAGDVTGEGKDDLIITGMGTDTRIAVLLHNDQFQLSASNYAVAFPTASAGQVRLGDVTGDGWNDVVMIDAANNQVLLFINKANGSFGGADDVVTAARPIPTSTGTVAAQAIAVGDVTGDGRADMVVTLHRFGDLHVPGQFRDNLLVHFFDSRGAAPFRPNGGLDGGFGPVAASSTPFRSDVMLLDLNDDRFPEVVVASPFQGTGGIRAWRLNCQLDNANLLTFSDSFFFDYTTGSASPHRLTAARYQSSRPDVLLASGDNLEAVQFVFSSYTPSNKTYDLIIGASTDSDSDGKAGTNGVYSYSVDVGGVITYSLDYVNNSASAITGGVVDCLLPSNLDIESGDAGYTSVPAGASKFIRWTLDVPAGTSGVKAFSVRVRSGTPGTKLALKGNFKRGTSVLVTKPMPVVELEEPLDLRVTTVTTSDSSGQRAHTGETITYRLRVKNLGTGPISGFKVGMTVPAGTFLIGGTSPPNPVLTGTFPNYRTITWTNLSLLANTELTMEVRVEVRPSAAEGTIIKNNTATVTRSDGPKVVAPLVSVRIDPPLEVTLSSNKNTVRPGETIRYTFTAKNWLPTAVTNAKVVNQMPKGASLLAAGANDATGGPGSNGSFVFSAGTWTAAQLSLTTLPVYDSVSRVMLWVLGSVGGGEQRTIEFDAIVAQDIPTFANINGVSTTLEVQNTTFNFIANTGTKRIFAGKPTSIWSSGTGHFEQLSSALTARRALLSDPPLAAPNLTLFKTAHGDGETTIAGEAITTVINDTSITTDGLCDYKLSYFNWGLGIARNVAVRDYVPFNMSFVGNIWRNGAPPVSLVGYRFYDAAGKQMPIIGAEGFTDTNANGFYDLGETYSDTNSNKKYDGVTASLVRSMDFPAGDMVFNASGSFMYRTKTASSPGIMITSPAGVLSSVKNGLDYTKVNGYHLTADNLHFPVNGVPKQVKVLVTGPAAFDFPFGIQKSRSEMVGSEITQVVIPFALIGGDSLTLSGVKMTLTIPKGYLITEVVTRDKTNQTRPGTVTRNSAGIATITFPINEWHSGIALFKVQLDAATKSVLKGINGQIKAPLGFTPTLSGSYLKSTKLTSIINVTRLLGALPVRDTVVAPPAPRYAVAAAMASPIATLGDSKVFVGRCAPVSVKRGDTFRVTIFVGNLTELRLGRGTIEMTIPPGCDYISASNYRFNTFLPEPDGDGFGVVFTIPKHAGGKVTWDIGSFMPREGGAVTLMLKVRDDFNGTRIDENSCRFDVVNASGKTPGPMAITVIAGNQQAKKADIISNTTSGLGVTLPKIPFDFFFSNFALTNASCTISIGGADHVQLNNGVVVVQMLGNRVLAIGPPSAIIASATRLVAPDSTMRIAVGPGASDGVQLTQLPTLLPSVVQPANVMLANLNIVANSLVAASGGNLVAAGGGNMVAAGGGNLVGNDGASLIGNDGSTLRFIAELVAAGGGNLIGNDGSTLVAAGGGNLVAAGGGNLVAAGGGNLFNPEMVRQLGDNNAALVAAGALNLVGQDGGSLVAAGGGNLIAAGGGNIIENAGFAVLANKP